MKPFLRGRDKTPRPQSLAAGATLTLRCGDQSVAVPITEDGLRKFERVSGVSIRQLPDHPNLPDLIPCLAWAIVSVISPVTREAVASAYESRDSRENAARIFRQQLRPDPSTN